MHSLLFNKNPLHKFFAKNLIHWFLVTKFLIPFTYCLLPSVQYYLSLPSVLFDERLFDKNMLTRGCCCCRCCSFCRSLTLSARTFKQCVTATSECREIGVCRAPVFHTASLKQLQADVGRAYLFRLLAGQDASSILKLKHSLQSAKVKVSNKSRPSVRRRQWWKWRTYKLQGRSVVRQKKADPLVVPIPVWGDGPGDRPSHGMRTTRGRTKRGSDCLFSSTLYYARAT